MELFVKFGPTSGILTNAENTWQWSEYGILFMQLTSQITVTLNLGFK